MSNINTNTSTTTTETPSLLAAHVQYVKGVAEETIGNVTGSSAWSESGTTDKKAATDDMKAASANRDPQRDGYGKAEEIAGKLTGCEGMVQEGSESRQV